MQIVEPPEAATGSPMLATPINVMGDKRAVGALAGGMSVRWVDDQIRRGMPFMKFGKRRVRFDLEEVREWLKEKYGQQRRGKVATA